MHGTQQRRPCNDVTPGPTEREFCMSHKGSWRTILMQPSTTSQPLRELSGEPFTPTSPLAKP